MLRQPQRDVIPLAGVVVSRCWEVVRKTKYVHHTTVWLSPYGDLMGDFKMSGNKYLITND
jgi:hypothetical protein